MFVVFIILSVFLSLALGQFVVVDNTCNDISVGVGASAQYAINTASDTSGNLFTNLGKNGVWTTNNSGIGLSLDCAINSKGQSYMATTGSIKFSNDSTTFTTVEGVVGLTQSINYFADNENVLGAVGSFFIKGKGSSTGVLLLPSVSFFDIPAYVRYGAFPSADVWFVSAGTWPADSVVSEGYRQHSRRISFNHEIRKAKFDLSESNRKLQSSTDDISWSAQVWMTTNGGVSFDMVFNAPTDSTFYFNGISCGDVNTCVVVGEGDDSNGVPFGVIYTTQDGGQTWTETMNTGSILTVMAVTMINNKIGYFAATTKNGRSAEGTFYYTSDGGMTWTAQQTLTDCAMILDLDFNADGSAGYATCMSASGSKGCVAQYIQ